MIDQATVQKLCAEQPEAVLEYPFGPQAAVYKVKGKMFALVSAEWVNLKVDPLDGQALRANHRYIRPGWHMNKKHWITVDYTEETDLGLVESLVDDSYDLVVAKLPAKTRATLDR